ncbi:MAG: aminotransferase class III-fold pyridoxal phosphate-dependent enzyme [Xanthomonadales bacterium]|nr:aminotransferase class III-fold pyridoxal phosphate-dependent enzyme [Xanthomonadales bacterium]
MDLIKQLEPLRTHGGARRTVGLEDAVIERFAARDARLVDAIESAAVKFEWLRKEEPGLLEMDETSQIEAVQEGIVNFYAEDAVSPFVALSARGPWIVTLKGAVIHDNGGYGMLGFGHAPSEVLDAMNGRQVMANIMTPNVSQKRFIAALGAEIGHTREAGCPYSRFLFLNSGSESVTMAARMSDINAKRHTDPGGRYAGCEIRRVGLTKAFHGRTDRPAQFSDSTRKTYARHLATFRDNDSLITVAPNDSEQLEQVFAWAKENRIFIEAMFIEPVMGEGNPGMAITPAFYARARELTRAHGALLLVDSIQAGLRAHGVLSICDYPGFEALDPPDMETYSKAVNAGQYPLSVLAMTGEIAALYHKGIYGNTMTSNPRAMDVGQAVLKSMTPDIRRNIRERGREFVARFTALQAELGGAINRVQGTGLLFSLELNEARYKSYGTDSIEDFMRVHGINVIHGGQNSLRYTPPFTVTSEEVDLIVEATRKALVEGPVRAQANIEDARSAQASTEDDEDVVAA